VGGFLAMWAFLAPAHVGQGQVLWVRLNCQLYLWLIPLQ